MKAMPFKADMVQAIQEGRKTVTRRVVKEAGVEWEFQDMEQDPVAGVVNRSGELIAKDLKGMYACFSGDTGDGYPLIEAPYQPGEVVYVPEAWKLLEMWESPVWRRTGGKVELRGGEVVQFNFYDRDRAAKWWKYADKPKEHWQSPYFMPREAARTFLRITGIHVEKLRDAFFENGSTILHIMAEGIDVCQQCKECLETYGGRPTCNDIDQDLPFVEELGEDTDGGSECGILDEERGSYSDLWDRTVKPKDRDRFGWSANPWVWVIEFERISKEEAEKCTG